MIPSSMPVPVRDNTDVDSNDGGAGIDTFVISHILGDRVVDLTAGIWTTGSFTTATNLLRGTLTQYRKYPD